MTEFRRATEHHGYLASAVEEYCLSDPGHGHPGLIEKVSRDFRTWSSKAPDRCLRFYTDQNPQDYCNLVGG